MALENGMTTRKRKQKETTLPYCRQMQHNLDRAAEVYPQERPNHTLRSNVDEFANLKHAK